MKWRGRWYFIKPWKKFFLTYSVLKKSAYHLIVVISVELPTYYKLHGKISKKQLPNWPKKNFNLWVIQKSALVHCIQLSIVRPQLHRQSGVVNCLPFGGKYKNTDMNLFYNRKLNFESILFETLFSISESLLWILHSIRIAASRWTDWKKYLWL